MDGGGRDVWGWMRMDGMDADGMASFAFPGVRLLLYVTPGPGDGEPEAPDRLHPFSENKKLSGTKNHFTHRTPRAGVAPESDSCEQSLHKAFPVNHLTAGLRDLSPSPLN